MHIIWTNAKIEFFSTQQIGRCNMKADRKTIDEIYIIINSKKVEYSKLKGPRNYIWLEFLVHLSRLFSILIALLASQKGNDRLFNSLFRLNPPRNCDLFYTVINKNFLYINFLNYSLFVDKAL